MCIHAWCALLTNDVHFLTIIVFVFILICLIFLHIISTEGLTGLGLYKPDLPATHLLHPTKS